RLPPRYGSRGPEERRVRSTEITAGPDGGGGNCRSMCLPAPQGRDSVTRGETMGDREVTEEVNALAREGHELFDREAKGTATEGARQRVQKIQSTLDQGGALLRQRRARREFGQDPEQARPRDEKTIKGYTG